DGILDDLVTGVQTCALPISFTKIIWVLSWSEPRHEGFNDGATGSGRVSLCRTLPTVTRSVFSMANSYTFDPCIPRQFSSRTAGRSEERRVGKESGRRASAWQ